MERLESHIRREQIAEAALAIISDHGVAGVTVKRVSQMVGITPGALYRHYRDKIAIMEAVLDLLKGFFLENLARAREEAKGSLGVLHHMLLRQVRLIQRYRIIPLVIFSDSSLHRDPGLAEKIKRQYEELRSALGAVVLEGQEAGEIRRDIGTKDIVVSFLGISAIPSLLSRWGMEQDLPTMVEGGWKLFLKGAETGGGPVTRRRDRTVIPEKGSAEGGHRSRERGPGDA